MTRDQAKFALDRIADQFAGSVNAGVSVYLNGGTVLHGRDVAYDEVSGLLIMDSGRAYVRAEQTAAIEVAQGG